MRARFEAIVPADLREQVAKLVEDDRALSWDAAVTNIASATGDDES